MFLSDNQWMLLNSKTPGKGRKIAEQITLNTKYNKI